MFHPIFCLDNAVTSSRISEKLNNQFVIATHFEPLFVMPVQYFPKKPFDCLSQFAAIMLP